MYKYTSITTIEKIQGFLDDVKKTRVFQGLKFKMEPSFLRGEFWGIKIELWAIDTNSCKALDYLFEKGTLRKWKLTFTKKYTGREK